MKDALPPYLPWQADLLERALALKSGGHLPHALLIDSASTLDLRPFVRQLSMLLLCDAPSGLDPCGACDACRMMLAGTYADFRLVTLEVDDKTQKVSKNIKIEQIRNLIHEVSLTRHYARLKIAAIYPAEAMNQASANALLKTLEEPAPGVLILLFSHNRGRIPITLRSRCQRQGLALPPRPQALDWLRARGFDDAEAATYLNYAGGDPLLAVALRDSDYASLVERFKTRLGGFLRGDLGVIGLCREMPLDDSALLRRLVNMTLGAYCMQTSGLDNTANPRPGADRKRARELLDLRRRAQNQLRVEENNLDLQIQLEDVLISLKQILTRRSV